MIDDLRKIWILLSSRERLHAVLLLLQMIASAFINVFGIALIFPFMTLILEPKSIFSNHKFFLLYQLFNFSSAHKFLIAFGIFLFFTVILSDILSALTAWFSNRFSYMRLYTFGSRLLKYYFSRPYVFYLSRNTASLTQNVAVEVRVVITNILLGFISLATQLINIGMIVALLFYVNSMVALFALGAVGGIYSLIYVIAKNKLMRISRENVQARKTILGTTNEGFNGIKDIKILGIELPFIQRYQRAVKALSSNMASYTIIGVIPKYVLEAVAFGSIILFLIILLVRGNNPEHIIPLLSLYVFAGYRLMPAMQMAFTYIAQIKATSHSLKVIYDDLSNMEKSINVGETARQCMSLNKEIKLDKISFTYPNCQTAIIKNLSLSIPVNSVVGFVGSTGAGKTTIIDITLGLLRAQSGKILIDGAQINGENLRTWQNNLGYVPQHIYLCDDTIARNIAFGIDDEKIDLEMVKKAAEMAALSNFVETELPKQYNTFIGDRGIRISGGQRQRLGIARALYHDPDVLVFDEATSSLDGVTEQVIMDAIHSLGHKKTIIIVAHRLTTVRECDKIFLLGKGKLIDQGSYNELMERSEIFQRMAKTGKKEKS
jgi:ATP-binding cassette, subfamily B, bacterial PglK